MTAMWLKALSLALSSGTALGMAPPHPELFADYEGVHRYRERLNITYNYKPQHMSDEHCRYMTEEDCQAEDEQHAENKRLRRLNPRKGEVKVFVMMIRFPEDRNKPLADVDYWKQLFSGEGTSDVNPAGSIKDFLYLNSLHQYKVTFVFDEAGWVTAPRSAKDYAGGNSARNGARWLQNVFRWRLNELDDEGFDWTKFDMDGDKWLDGIIALHSGYPAEFGVLPCHSEYKDRIWSQGVWGPASDGWVSKQDAAIGLSGFAVTTSIGNEGICNDLRTPMGIVTHEFLHTFGLVDLYDQDWSKPYVMGGVGSLDIICNAYGWDRRPARPGILSSYSRKALGWSDPIPIESDGYYSIQPYEISGLSYIMSKPYPEDEYLLIEMRQPIKWDSNFPGGGIVIFHVDDTAGLQKTRGYPGSNDWPKNHYRVSSLQADGNYDLEKGTNVGDDGDFWRKDMVLGSDTRVWPNTASIQSGTAKSTGVKITIMSESSFVMLFQVEGLGSSSGGAPPIVGNIAEESLGLETVGGSLRGAPGYEDPSKAGSTIAWVLSMLASASVLVGVFLVFF